MTDTVTFEVGEDRVGVVTLNRPGKLNAMDADVFRGLRAAATQAAQAAAERSCRAVLLIGAGRAFSAGLDLELFGEQAAHGPPDQSWIAELQQAFTAYEDLPVPTVAAVHGVALGAGCQLALACHLRVCAADARFALLEARWGLIPDLGATWRLPRLVGLGRATDMAITTRQVDAQTALAWGLANAVLPGEGGRAAAAGGRGSELGEGGRAAAAGGRGSADGADFAARARDWVARLAAGATVATGTVPGLMGASYGRTRDEVLAAERAAQLACLRSGDFREAVAAAQAQRDPDFHGK